MLGVKSREALEKAATLRGFYANECQAHVITRLLREGLIAHAYVPSDIRQLVSGRRYVITDAGRKALEGT